MAPAERVTSMHASDDAIVVRPFEGAESEWDAFVRAQRGWTHYHQYGWRRVMERAFGHECLYLEARDARGALVGVLPLVRVKSVLFGHFLVSLPFLNYGGPLGTDDGVRALAAHAATLARGCGAKLLELRSRVPLPVEMHESHRKITVHLPLVPGDAQAVWKALPSRARNSVRRASKSCQVEVRHGIDQLDSFYRIFSHHMRDLGTPTLPRRFFAEIAREFPDAVFSCCYLDGKPAAVGCSFVFDGQIEIVWGSALRLYNELKPNAVLYWSLMEQACERGLERFDFGRCTPGSNTHKFKLSWGAEDAPLWWYDASDGGEVKTPSPNDSAYAWGPRLWKKLPVPVATALGPSIVKYIP